MSRLLLLLCVCTKRGRVALARDINPLLYAQENCCSSHVIDIHRLINLRPKSKWRVPSERELAGQ